MMCPFFLEFSIQRTTEKYREYFCFSGTLYKTPKTVCVVVVFAFVVVSTKEIFLHGNSSIICVLLHILLYLYTSVPKESHAYS